MAARVWTCQRQTAGQKCGHVNPKRRQICESCGKRRPPTKKPAHMAVLDEMTYEDFAERFGERCGICGKGPDDGVRLVRDHDHRSGIARGLLCFRCNHSLPSWREVEWMEKALAYLRRAHELSAPR